MQTARPDQARVLPTLRLTRGMREIWARACEVSPRGDEALTTRLLVVRGGDWGSINTVATTVVVSFGPSVTLMEVEGIIVISYCYIHSEMVKHTAGTVAVLFSLSHLTQYSGTSLYVHFG